MINILFCGNKGVFDGILTASVSIMKRCGTKEPFAFYLFTMELTEVDAKYLPITDADAALLCAVCKKYNAENEVHLIDVGDIYRRELLHCPNEDAYCSAYTLLRLLADLVSGMPDKILYLDTDVMFNRDIRLLYKIPIADVEYAAARDHYGKYLVRWDYVNAGVLLLNMKRIRESGLFEKARTRLLEKKLLFADQSALIRATEAKKLLPQRFNDQKFLHKSTVVRHFSKRLFYLPYPHVDNVKPWQVDRMRKIFGYRNFDDILDEYVKIKTENERK